MLVPNESPHLKFNYKIFGIHPTTSRYSNTHTSSPLHSI